ncbi:mycofactocin biosynthesis glycosyltransferase MftF [Gordonia hydrophobica]|uniref:Mycofactocin biosynthesis glycosyltransferase MftF n=1 Tax=Gordonia hydrophobica TaxID=40516 RepID=A0ABZ2TWI5_9ACTN|nr:mycofactocin biosynthesis glycosyltransferase MftF [Gordonia hydrophobica]MBM7365757.1 mycofactocin system glycosyltransferase [Gordonia hydrophobica]
MTSPSTTDLPVGFQVQIDHRCVRRGDLRTLVGGSPLRVLKLSDAALGMTSDDGRIEVCDAGTRGLARKLLDAGIAHPRPMTGPREDQVTVVIPARGNQAGVDRLIAALPGLRVIVVDDGSPTPLTVPDDDLCRVIRFEVNAGPAAARNAGFDAADTPFVAFLDSDTVPRGEWLMMLLSHFSDPMVGIVAPRIVGLEHDRHRRGRPVAAYANQFSSLDMGPHEGPVRPGTPIAYVPSAALVVRREAFGRFDETLRVAEDVDLCWRTHAAGWVVRYDPIAHVAHDHRDTLRGLLGRRRFYGTGAAQLASRHGGLVAPVMTSVPLAVAVLALLSRTRIGFVVATVLSGWIFHRLRGPLAGVPARDLIAARNVGRALGFGVLQVWSAVLRHYWPLSVVGLIVSPRFRRWFVEAAIAEAVATWVRTRLDEPSSPMVEPLGYSVMHRLDDFAYGLGLWQGAIAGRSLGALRPVVTR